MPPNLPLSIVIVEIVKHTPTWAWAVLAVLVVLGALQMRDHVVTRTRVVIAPLALGAYSLWGAGAAFGARPEVVAAWAAGLGLALAANRLLEWPRNVRPQADGSFALQASVWPLAAMLAVFALRYVAAVTLVFHPGWARDAGFSLAMAAAYGALCGLFAARALRILRSAADPGRRAAPAPAAQQAR